MRGEAWFKSTHLGNRGAGYRPSLHQGLVHTQAIMAVPRLLSNIALARKAMALGKHVDCP